MFTFWYSGTSSLRVLYFYAVGVKQFFGGYHITHFIQKITGNIE